MGNLYKIKREVEKTWENYKIKTAKPNKDALWIFGMQKSGTTAIAALLAKRAGKTSTLDTPLLWTPYIEQLEFGNIVLKNHIKSNAYDFSKDIIKEPNATFLFNELKQVFRLNKYIVIIRNPFDTIRSILNRLNIPGNLREINIAEVDENWQHLFFNNGKQYIEDLTCLWKKAYDGNMLDSASCILVRYEDFNKNKLNFIDKLCFDLNYEIKADINHLLNKKFQPPGHRNIKLEEFFGDENYNFIKNNCSGLLKKYYG